MGVPKFFRWMSERYPAISQLIAENRIPEFDCLYLDMNGIIHNCTHKDSDDTSFRMTEEEMFIAIFNYIEHLFGKIKPKKLFFMAVDGVAPRAKMNQQRARRFRTALDVETALKKAIKEGKEIPKEDAFDSNSITPGTEFMHKLTAQLKYFIHKKVSEDTDWQGVKVLFSGQEVPGEGEHKIMEYIRLAKAQPDYDPNVRHCLYGLDADLIMLGLLSHDPHFCLLREEVTFGRVNKTKSRELEHQKFYLMHLCLVREYLELEFQELKKPDFLKFKFDLERVIDDFVLMAFFVGNDFLPNLPNLHINEGALALMFKFYKKILPKIGGYINESGVINMERLTILLQELSQVEYRFFEADTSDKKWFNSKQMAKKDIVIKESTPDKIEMTSSQKEIWLSVKNYLSNPSSVPIDLPYRMPAADKRFLQHLSQRAHLKMVANLRDNGNVYIQLYHLSFEKNEESLSEDELFHLAHVINLYDKAEIIDFTPAQLQTEMDREYEEKFQQWKKSYYVEKFEWDYDNEEKLVSLCENYVQGLQWVLFYYYRGVASWSWYYRYHYSPMISDVIKGLRADVNFKLGKPFQPFEQLMGVLPDRSKNIVPVVYQDLMTNPASPIYDFYPREFELDLNGKKMGWEAVVKIPFIDEKRLLDAMALRNNLLIDEERERNKFGTTMQFSYNPEVDNNYVSSLCGIFPNIAHCHCEEKVFELPTIEGLEYHIGLMDGVKLGETALAGFPSLSFLPFNASLEYHDVSVFQRESQNESMIVTIDDPALKGNSKHAVMKIGKRVFVGYPYLQEGKVVKVSDELFDYFPSNDGIGQPLQKRHSQRDIEEFSKKAVRIEINYSKRLGIIIGQVTSITHVEMLKGLKKTGDGATVKEYANIPGMETEFASQIIVDNVINEDHRFLEQAPLSMEEEFPPGTRAFFLGDPNYGRPLEIISHQNNCVQIWLSVATSEAPNFAHQIIREYYARLSYTPSYAVAQMLNLNPLLLSKITSSFSVTTLGKLRLNVGLNLKFESKKLKVLGYSQKCEKNWEYSSKAIELITTYKTKFPEFFEGIQRNIRASEFQATDFYPEEIADSKIKEIAEWLKSIESKSFERVSLDSEQLDSEAVAAFENAIKKANDATLSEMNQSCKSSYKRLKGIPRNALIKPADAEHRLGNQKFSLGDRVVYVQDSGRVPIATRGTVVGISQTPRSVLLDVLFDETFMSGTTLSDRCSPFRGSTVPISSVINLTNKQLVVLSKTNFKENSRPEISPNNSSQGQKQILGSRGPYYNSVSPTLGRGGYGNTFLQSQNTYAYSSSNHPVRGRNAWPSSENSQVNRGHLAVRGGPKRYPSQTREWGTTNLGRGQGSNQVPLPQYESYHSVPPPDVDSSIATRHCGRGRGRGRPGSQSSRGRGFKQTSSTYQP